LNQRSAVEKALPENMARRVCALLAKRATRATCPASASKDSGTMLARSPRPNADSASARTPRSALSAAARREPGTINVAPSPPNMNGSSMSRMALHRATMELTPSAFTSL
jgi:hypothetical protein